MKLVSDFMWCPIFQMILDTDTKAQGFYVRFISLISSFKK